MIIKRKRKAPFKFRARKEDMQPWKFIALLNIPEVKRAAVAEYIYGSGETNQRSLLSRKSAGLLRPSDKEIQKTLEFYASLKEEIEDILSTHNRM
jgi:hypothetical protein